MAYGIEIDNSSGVLQIEETHLKLGLVSSGTATCTTAFGGASRLYSTTITKSTNVTFLTYIFTSFNFGEQLTVGRLVKGLSNVTVVSPDVIVAVPT